MSASNIEARLKFSDNCIKVYSACCTSNAYCDIACESNSSYIAMSSDWETRAASKRKAILDGIPQKWHLSKIPSKEEQKDVTGAYIHQFLDQKEIEITETDAVGIAEKVAAGQWTAVAVTEAFCHRAALAHQLV